MDLEGFVLTLLCLYMWSGVRELLEDVRWALPITLIYTAWLDAHSRSCQKTLVLLQSNSINLLGGHKGLFIRDIISLWLVYRVLRLHGKSGILSFTFPGLENAWNLLQMWSKAGILMLYTRALYHITIYRLYRYFGYTLHIVSFILVTRYFKQYIFA